jgi:16S rRNA processing protein RimM
MKDSKPLDETLIVADIVGAYGIKGWVKLRIRLEEAGLLATLTDLTLANPSPTANLVRNSIEIKELKQQGKGFVARLAGVSDRTAAEFLKGYQICMPARLFPDAGDGEFYWRELMGCEVWCRDGADPVLLGVVVKLLETGANDVMVVAPNDHSVDDKEHLVPWIPDQVVEEVDLDNKRIGVNWYVDA